MLSTYDYYVYYLDMEKQDPVREYELRDLKQEELSICTIHHFTLIHTCLLYSNSIGGQGTLLYPEMMESWKWQTAAWETNPAVLSVVSIKFYSNSGVLIHLRLLSCFMVKAE